LSGEDFRTLQCQEGLSRPQSMLGSEGVERAYPFRVGAELGLSLIERRAKGLSVWHGTNNCHTMKLFPRCILFPHA
ncbi:hypothetical protein Micbo1qcDRAFT_169974, partial [Microdochium bolleyi]